MEKNIKLKNIIKNTIREVLHNQKLKEISSDTFKSAINVSKNRGTDKRTYELGGLYFNQFIGKPLVGGKIINIGVQSPLQSNYKIVLIEIEKKFINDSGGEYNKKIYINYDIDKDNYDIDEIDRKDAVVLSKIAQHINPDTKYRETGKYFDIKGWKY
jgi:hypothetical protein